MLRRRFHHELGTAFECMNAGVSLAAERRIAMLVAIAVVLLVLALAGGIAINPLLFLLALLALVVFLGGGRRGTVL
jgi:regulator of sirC expression with transglutaminase-like and TPR domain